PYFGSSSGLDDLTHHKAGKVALRLSCLRIRTASPVPLNEFLPAAATQTDYLNPFPFALNPLPTYLLQAFVFQILRLFALIRVRFFESAFLALLYDAACFHRPDTKLPTLTIRRYPRGCF